MSLRRLITLNLLTIALLLLALVTSGLLYNQYAAKYKKIIREGEEIIFTFTTIREQTTQALLLDDGAQLLAAAAQFDKLHSRYTALLENSIFATQYKLSLLKGIDLAGLVIDLRKSQSSLTDNKDKMAIIGRLRQLNDQFMAFDRVVVSEMKDRVLVYQKIALALSGLLICLLLFTVMTMYRRLVQPMTVLAGKLAAGTMDPATMTVPSSAAPELVDLVAFWQDNIPKYDENTEGNAQRQGNRDEEFGAVVNEVTNHLNGIINYSQLLADYCASQGIAGEHKDIVQQIISEGEKSADILQKRLQGGDS